MYTHAGVQNVQIFFCYCRPMYIDSTNNTEPSGELPVARLMQANIEPLLMVCVYE